MMKSQELIGDDIYIVVKEVKQQPDEEKYWSYLFEEIPDLLEQIREGDRDNGCELCLYGGFLYECEEILTY